MSQPIVISTTRDLVRFRKLSSPSIQNIANSFLAHLAADSSASTQLRQAFFPALLGTDSKPKDPVQVNAADGKLRELFANPPTLVIPQGNISTGQIVAAWGEGEKSGTVMANSIFVSYAIHQELQNAKEGGEREQEANLSMMVIATIAHELAQWIYVKSHGLDGSLFGQAGDAVSIRTNGTGMTSSSVNSIPRYQDRNDVGDKAVLYLFGCDYELLTYTIGSREMTKRRFPTRRTPSLTPPIVYSIIGDTPAIFDATSHPPVSSRNIPQWQDPNDTMYTVVAILTPKGISDFHGKCTIGQENGQPEFEAFL